jgi:hypothetical protein
MTKSEIEWGAVPAACTLPAAQVTTRLAEFADVFAVVRAAQRPAPTELLLVLQPAPGRAAAVRDLAARESACCSFFDFTVSEEAAGVLLQITVPPTQAGVLDAMAAHAGVAAGERP